MVGFEGHVVAHFSLGLGLLVHGFADLTGIQVNILFHFFDLFAINCTSEDNQRATRETNHSTYQAENSEKDPNSMFLWCLKDSENCSHVYFFHFVFNNKQDLFMLLGVGVWVTSQDRRV